MSIHFALSLVLINKITVEIEDVYNKMKKEACLVFFSLLTGLVRMDP